MDPTRAGLFAGLVSIVASASASAQRTPPVRPMEDFCRLERLTNRARIAQSIRAPRERAALQSLIGDFCAANVTDAWALEITQVDAGHEDVRATGTWNLVHIDGNARRVTEPLEFSIGASTHVVRSLRASDANGDGTSEAFITWHSEQPYVDHPDDDVHVWRVQGTTLQRRTELDALHPHGTIDIDDDHRLDLLVAGPFFAMQGRCEGGEWSVVGPELLAHALPDGRFALDDETARNYARRTCASAPTVFAIAQSGRPLTASTLDTDRTASAIACARIWNVPSARIHHALDAVCTGGYVGICQSDTGLEPGTPDDACADRLAAWADERSPVTLGAPPASGSGTAPSSGDTVLRPAHATESSYLHNRVENHPAEHAFDGDRHTAWNDGVPGTGQGEWRQADFDAPVRIHEIRLDTGWDYNSPRAGDLFTSNSHLRVVRIAFDGGTIVTREIPTNTRRIVVDHLEQVARSVRITAAQVWDGARYHDLCISEVEFVGRVTP